MRMQSILKKWAASGEETENDHLMMVFNFEWAIK